MTATAIAGLITGATGLVTAIITLVRLLQHVNSPSPHPRQALELPAAGQQPARPAP